MCADYIRVKLNVEHVTLIDNVVFFFNNVSMG